MLQNQTISAITSTLRAFDPVSDTLDILIISFAFYQLIQFAANPKPASLYGASCSSCCFTGWPSVLNLRTVTWVLNNVVTIGFTAAVVIFQPELRRTLERMGQTTVWAGRLFGTVTPTPSCGGCGRARWWRSATRRSSFPTRAPAR